MSSHCQQLSFDFFPCLAFCIGSTEVLTTVCCFLNLLGDPLPEGRNNRTLLLWQRHKTKIYLVNRVEICTIYSESNQVAKCGKQGKALLWKMIYLST